MIVALPGTSFGGEGTVPSELGNEVLRLDAIHFRAIEAATAELEPMVFPPMPFDIDSGNYEIAVLENENFYSVLFLDKVRIEDCENPHAIEICFSSAGTPGLLELAVTVSKDATRVFGWELLNTADYRTPE